MCGIGGVISSTRNSVNPSDSLNTFERILKESQSRGRDASGVTFINAQKIVSIKLTKQIQSLFKSSEYIQQIKEYLHNKKESYFCILGHTRLATNGNSENNLNNQPFTRDGITAFHNGIITNYKNLADSLGFSLNTEVDSEIIPIFFRDGLNKKESLEQTTNRFFESIEGTASIALFIHETNQLLLATNNGAIYYYKKDGFVAFASQKNFLVNLNLNENIFRLTRKDTCLAFDLNASEFNNNSEEARSFVNNRKFSQVELGGSDCFPSNSIDSSSRYKKRNEITNFYSLIEKKVEALRRCKTCILPETFPFISFNAHGICNYCENFYMPSPLGEQQFINDFVSVNKNTKVLVGLSGGRDSCYGLHLIRKYFKEVYAFSYDWGVITDLARRNQARMCSKLDVEHIYVAADLKYKRNNIKSNFNAWLSGPDLGTVPLLMAGDKHYFYYANKIKESYGIDHVFFGENLLETTFFKYGFCGIPPKFDRNKSFHLNWNHKLKMISYYLGQFITRPKYINSSLIDSIKGFLSFYFIDHQYHNIYRYFSWEEKEVNRVLLNEYNWETDPEYSSTWRIGDGTAPVYNLIYFLVAGFCEIDTLRSNQVRLGQISRDEAMKLLVEESRPRFNAIDWYCQTIGIKEEIFFENLISYAKESGIFNRLK